MLPVFLHAYSCRMPNTFITDWKKIGQSGPTMDGREIEGQWLLDAADTYDPDTYTAVIWIDHFRFHGSFGKVVALKAEEKDGIVSLYAKLQPNEWLLSQNKNKQKLFTSMELTPDFAKTGKCYLTGLAVTDIPASLGTSELHFSHRKQNPDNFLVDGVELGDLQEELSESEAITWFTKTLRMLGCSIPNNQGDSPEPEEDTMTEQQFNALMGKFDDQDKRLASLEHFAAQKPKQDEEGKGSDAGAAPEAGKQDFSAEVNEAIKPFTEKLGKMEAAFNAKVDDLTKRFEQAKPGTPVPETQKPADGAKVL
ncbi:Capsid scaffolding [Pseudodesulfovibrio profundus]|uniref:Capsid scaffolding n=2 Tax=Pseudodesulfovibrio profundus TaxID=57320 RepID=A0A2C8FCM9_9BACT|nr:Capsid scaffolding [Pseudodesulfovibrio profundus]